MVLAISNHGHMLGGGEHSFLDLVSHLPEEWKAISAVPYDGELAERLRDRGLETQALAMPSLRPWTLVKIFAAIRAYLGLCRSAHPRLIYANGSRAAFYGGIVGRIFGVPAVWHCRVMQADPFFDSMLTRLNTVIVTNSHATAGRFAPPFQDKVRVSYNGVDLDWLQNGEVGKPDLVSSEWQVILVVARVSREKRHDLILSAFERVAEANSRAHLVCLGAKAETDLTWWNHLQEKTGMSPYSSRIHWLGQVEDLRPWYRCAHIVAMASESEAFGRVLVEAMGSGVPVVASRTGGISEIVRHMEDGLLVAPGSMQELAESMERLLSNRALRKTFGVSAQQRAQSFRLEKHVIEMIQIFEDTMNSYCSHLTGNATANNPH